MELKEIAEIGVYIVGAGALCGLVYSAVKEGIKSAEKKGLEDESPKFSDLEKEANYVGKKVKFNGTDNLKIEENKFYDNTIKSRDLQDKTEYIGKTVSF